MDLARSTNSMPRSGIRVFMDMAWAAGDVVHLEVGEPSFPTPRHVVDAADAAARAGQTKYVANAGTPELRAAIADKLRSRNGWEVTSDDVVVTAGGVEALYLCLLALLSPGDGVLVPDPGWPNFRMMTTALRGSVLPYRLRPKEGYQPCVEDLEAAARPSAKVLILNSPSNPLGSVVSSERITEILAWASARGIWVVSDECYDELVFDGTFASVGPLDPEARAIGCYSFSKTYAMTGWRVGYAVTTEPVVRDSLARLQEAVVSCVNAPAQAAAVAALHGPQGVVGEMRDVYLARRDGAVSLLAAAGVDVLVPSGAFYLWLDTSPWASDDWALATELLTESRVAVAPGSAFGENGRGFLRVSLATETAVLFEGLERVVSCLKGSETARR